MMTKKPHGIGVSKQRNQVSGVGTPVPETSDAHTVQMTARSMGLLEATSDAMVVVNQRGEIVMLTRRAEEEFGYRRDLLLGKQLEIIIPGGFSGRLIKEGGEALAQQICAGLHLTGRRKDGSEFPIEVTLCALANDEALLVIKSDGMSDAEKQLKQMESRYRRLLEAAPDAMVVVNQHGEIVLLNLRAEQVFGYSRDELLDKKLTKIIQGGLENALQAAGNPRASTVGNEVELTGLRKDGTEFPIEIMLRALDSVEGIVVVRDISVRKRTEHLKEEFVSTVSHELRTPLTSISASLGLLIGQGYGALPESAMRLITIAHTNSKRLVRLINDILDIEKLESGMLTFRMSQVAMDAIVAQAIVDTSGFAESHHVKISLHVASAGCDVNADPDRVIQVITNLLSNAIKFSPAGGEVVVVVEKLGTKVRVSVRDRGCGISVAFRPRVFEKFAQSDPSSSREFGGTGLGLSIVKQITERLGGNVGFEDAPGGGTVFFLDLPEWQHSMGGELDLEAEGGATPILLVEDDRDLAINIREQLRPGGFSVDFAHSAAVAIQRTLANSYAAILVDLQLPEINGLDLIHRLRSGMKDRYTPIIVIAGDPDRGRNDVRAFELNVLDWLRKPVDAERLILLLKSTIESRRPSHPRILHVDDDHDVQKLVAYALRSTGDVVSVDSLQSARRTLATSRIDLAIIDLSLGSASGLELLPDLRDDMGHAIPVIILSHQIPIHPCDVQIPNSFSKLSTSLESLIEAVRAQLQPPPISSNLEAL